MWRLHSLGEIRGPLWFLEKVRFSDTVHSPSTGSELAMLIAGVWGWGLHMASKSGVKPCLSRMSLELPNTTLLYSWYLKHSHEDFMLTSPQKKFYACFSSFLAFWAFCVEGGCCKLNEGRRQKMCKAIMNRITGRGKKKISPFYLCSPSQGSEICCSKTRLWLAGCLGRTEGCVRQPE